MKNIIFLDFDGPLFPNRVSFTQGDFKSIKLKANELGLGSNTFFWKMDDVAIGMLNKLNSKFDISFVISSSLAKNHSKNVIENWLKFNGFLGELNNDWTSSSKETISRLEEIEAWLKRNHVSDSYIIIDDEVSAPEMKNIQLVNSSSLKINRIVLISPENGILMSHYQKIEKLLNIF